MYVYASRRTLQECSLLLTLKLVPLTLTVLSVCIRSKQNKSLVVILTITSWFWILFVLDVNFRMGVNDGHWNSMTDTTSKSLRYSKSVKFFWGVVFPLGLFQSL